jgi:23S rRNA pseudouridine1911/1915/1917 synthase
VTVNGEVVTRFDRHLRRGDVVAIRSGRQRTPEPVIRSGIEIVFEDASLIVVEKPAGLLSIATASERVDTAYRHLNAYVRLARPRGARIWIVHRLDRETSGLMVFAKTAVAKHALQRGWANVEKRYWAVVEGSLPSDSGTLESDLDENEPGRVFSASRSESTRHALTWYRVLAHGSGRSLVELLPKTGRRHQLRVQLADEGCPIVGDQKYGATTDPASRLALHACGLALPHPETGERLSFESRLPRELARLVRRRRESPSAD